MSSSNTAERRLLASSKKTICSKKHLSKDDNHEHAGVYWFHDIDNRIYRFQRNTLEGTIRRSRISNKFPLVGTFTDIVSAYLKG